MLSSVSIWMGECSRDVCVLMSAPGLTRWPSNQSLSGPGAEDVELAIVNAIGLPIFEKAPSFEVRGRPTGIRITGSASSAPWAGVC